MDKHCTECALYTLGVNTADTMTVLLLYKMLWLQHLRQCAVIQGHFVKCCRNGCRPFAEVYVGEDRVMSTSQEYEKMRWVHVSLQHGSLFSYTVRQLSLEMMVKCWNICWTVPLVVHTRCVLELICQQPMAIEPCFNFLNTLSPANGPLTSIRIYPHSEKLFYEFGGFEVFPSMY